MIFRSYIAVALSNLERNRLHSGIAILGLAVGFAAAILIALFVGDELTYDRFIPGFDRVYRVAETLSVDGKTTQTDYTPTFLGPALAHDFSGDILVARMAPAGFPPSVRHGNVIAAEQAVMWADPDFFRVLPLPGSSGDLTHALDRPDSVVLTKAAAKRYFGRTDPTRDSLLIDGRAMRVSAVIDDLPPNSHLVGDIFPSSLSPASPMAKPDNNGALSNRVLTYFRLRPTSSAGEIQRRLPAFASHHFDLTRVASKGSPAFVQLHLIALADIHLHASQANQFTKPSGDPAIVAAVAGAGALIVLVAAINFVTLMTARSRRRAVEVGIRQAIGARRQDIFAQFMIEALVYVAGAGVVSVSIAELVLPSFNALVHRNIIFDYSHALVLLLSGAGFLLAVGAAAGLYPALALAGLRPTVALSGVHLPTTGGRIRKALVIVQFSILIVLFEVTLTIDGQLDFAVNVGPRLDKAHTMLLFAQPCDERLRDWVQKIPGVEVAACSSAMTLGLADKEYSAEVNNHAASLAVSPVEVPFFAVYRIRPLAGRLPDLQDMSTNVQAMNVVMNATAAWRFGFKTPAEAVGRTIGWRTNSRSAEAPLGAPTDAGGVLRSTIVGVVPDFTFSSVKSRIPPTVYFVSHAQAPPAYSIALNVRLNPHCERQTVAAIDADWPTYESGPEVRYSVSKFTARLYADIGVLASVVGACALVALSLASLGLFALSAYTTERRSKEIGIRKAMGASQADILRLLLWNFTQPVLWSAVIALPVAWGISTWWLSGFAYHVPLSPWSFAAAASGALIVAWATVLVHVWRSAGARPVTPLRYE